MNLSMDQVFPDLNKQWPWKFEDHSWVKLPLPRVRQRKPKPSEAEKAIMRMMGGDRVVGKVEVGVFPRE